MICLGTFVKHLQQVATDSVVINNFIYFLYFLFPQLPTSSAHPSAALQCHECSEQFSTRWEPRACQLNVSLVPVRDCLSEQTYCVVSESFMLRVVEGLLDQTYVRDCLSEQTYCVVSESMLRVVEGQLDLVPVRDCLSEQTYCVVSESMLRVVEGQLDLVPVRDCLSEQTYCVVSESFMFRFVEGLLEPVRADKLCGE